MKKHKKSTDLAARTANPLSTANLRTISGGGSRGEDAYFVRCDRSTITG